MWNRPMKIINSKVEYAIYNMDLVTPTYYNWQYCCQKNIPFIEVKPRKKYTRISYDLMSISKGLQFKNSSFLDQWLPIYDQYRTENSIPLKIATFVGGELNGTFTILKKDQEAIIDLLIREIKNHVNKLGYINPERVKYYGEIEQLNNLAKMSTKK